MDPHRRRHLHQPPYEAASVGRYVHSPLRSHPDSFDDRMHPSPLHTFFPPPPPPPQNPPPNHHANVHHHHYYQDPRRDESRYYPADKPHFAPEAACEPRRLEAMDFIPHPPLNPGMPERASLPVTLRKRWPEQREVLSREMWRPDHADEAIRVRVYEDRRIPLGWEEVESGVSVGRSHGLQSFQRDIHPRVLVDSGRGPSPGRPLPRREQIFALENDDAFLHVDGYEGRCQRKAAFWDEHHGGGGSRHHSRDGAYEPKPSEAPTLIPPRDVFPFDRYGEASSFAYSKARSPPLNPTESWVLPGKRVQPVSEAYVVDHDRDYWGSTSRGREKRTVPYSREDKQDLVITRKPSVLSRIQHSIPVWERLEEPNKVSSAIVRPERIEEQETSRVVCSDLLESRKLSSKIVHPHSPVFPDQEVTEKPPPVSLDASIKSNAMVAKEILVSATANEQNSGERNDSRRTSTEEPTRKTSASPKSNGTRIPRPSIPKRSLIKKSSTRSSQSGGSSIAALPTPKKKLTKGARSSNKHLQNPERKVKTLVSSQEEVFSGGSKKDLPESLKNQLLLKKDKECNEISISPVSDVTDPIGKITDVPFEEESSNEQVSNCSSYHKKQIEGTDMVSKTLAAYTSEKNKAVGFSGKLGFNLDIAQSAISSEMRVSPIPHTPESSRFVTATPITVETDAQGGVIMTNHAKAIAASGNLDKIVLNERLLLCQKAASSGIMTSNLFSDADRYLKSPSNLLLDDVPEATTEGALVKNLNKSCVNDTNRSDIPVKSLSTSNDYTDPEKENPITGCDGNLNSGFKMQIKRKRKKAKVVNPNPLLLSNPLTGKSSQEATSTSFHTDSAHLASPIQKRQRKKKRPNDCIIVVPSRLNTITETSEGLPLEDGQGKQSSITSCQDVENTNRDVFSSCDLELKYLKMSGSLTDVDPQVTIQDKCSSLLNSNDVKHQKLAEKTLAELTHPSLHVNNSNKTCKVTDDARKKHGLVQGENDENPACLNSGSLQVDIGDTTLRVSSEVVTPFSDRHGEERVAGKLESPCSLEHKTASTPRHPQEGFEIDHNVVLEHEVKKKSAENGTSQEQLTLQAEVMLHGNDASEMVPGIPEVSMVQDSVAPLSEKTHVSVSANASCSVFEKEHINRNMAAEDATHCSNYPQNCSGSRPISTPVVEFPQDPEPASKPLKEIPDEQGNPLINHGPSSIHKISDEVSIKTSAYPNRLSGSTSIIEIKPSGTCLPGEKKIPVPEEEAKTLMVGTSNVKKSSGNVRISQKVGVPNVKRYQPALSLPAPTRVAHNPQKMRHRTWHRADPPASQTVGNKRAQPKVSSLQQVLPNKPDRPLGSYVRKGNSLVRKSSAVPSSLSVTLTSNEKIRHEAAKSITNESSSGHLDNVNLLKSTGSIERSSIPPLPLMNRLSHGSSNPLNIDHSLEVTLEGAAESIANSIDIDREIPGNFNFASAVQSGPTISKAVVYMKPKSNQLVAANEVENCNLSSHVLENGKTQSSSSDLYYMRKKNQLIRDTSAGRNMKQKVSASPDVSSRKGHTSSGIVSSKYHNGASNRNIYKGTLKHSKSSRVWRLNAAEQFEKFAGRSRYIENLTSILPWKRPTSQWRAKISHANKQSLALISRKLRLSRKRDTLYTVSKGGFSLRKSGVRGIGGSNLKWSKSMEKRSRKANEEATLAVAEAERKKRERKRVSLGIYVKGGKCLSRERIFRVGKVRYRMDSSKKSLVRIPDEDPSTSNNQSGRNILASRIPSRLLIGHDEYVRIGNGNKLVRDPKKLVRILASEKVRWSLHTARTRLTKKQQYCQFFTRFGKCNKMGKDCPYIHDPSKIAICTKYLKGVCSGVNCSLTHKIDPKMMPDCSYFLRGLCNKATCPYRHVNVNSNAAVCEGFQKGYCAAGDECRKKHNFLCPVFEATGQCPQGSACKLHHPKHENKSKKRKRSEMRRQNKWRYFIPSHVEATQPESVNLIRYSGNKESEDVYSEGGTLEFISLNFDSEENNSEGVTTPRTYLVALDTDMIDAHQNSPDDLIKPIRIMKGKGLVDVDET